MEQFQCMTMMKLSKNKRIGKVLFIVEDAWIYYLFDRGRAPGSNSNSYVIKQFMSILRNSHDNGYDMQGMGNRELYVRKFL